MAGRPGFHQTTIMGHVGHIEAIRTTKAGDKALDFSVALNTPNEVIWYRVVVWNEIAISCSVWLKPGLQIVCIGEISAGKAILKANKPAALLNLEAHIVRIPSNIVEVDYSM